VAAAFKAVVVAPAAIAPKKARLSIVSSSSEKQFLLISRGTIASVPNFQCCCHDVEQLARKAMRGGVQAVLRKGGDRVRALGRFYLEGSLQSVAPEKSLRPMTPTRIKTKQHTRPTFGLSPKNAILMIAVPAVPMPTKAA
jgi:hypothetical protein